MQEYDEWGDASTLPDNESRDCFGCVRLGTGTLATDGSGTFVIPPGGPAPGSGEPGTGPYIHRNSAHLSRGLVSVRITDEGKLRVQFDGDGPIGTITVNGDETVAERHILIGASGGPQWFDISFYTGTRRLLLNVQADFNVVKNQFLNLWVHAVYAAVRGVGLPSKADRALTRVGELQLLVDEQAATLADLVGRVALLEQGGGS